MFMVISQYGELPFGVQRIAGSRLVVAYVYEFATRLSADFMPWLWTAAGPARLGTAGVYEYSKVPVRMHTHNRWDLI
jgi:hypothetical protein